MPNTKPNNSSSKKRKDTKVTDKRIMKVIEGMAEKKWHSTSYGTDITPYTISTSPSILEICEIPENVSSTGRIGNKIRPSSFKFGYTLTNSDSSNSIMRVIVFSWHDDSNPGNLDLVLLDSGTPQSMYSMYTQEQKRDFRVLYDRTHNLNINNNSQQTVSNQTIFKGLPAEIDFNSGASTGSSKLWISIQSNTDTAQAMSFVGNLRFTDI